MADHPIPFSPPMIAALLAGRKTQTRRALSSDYACSPYLSKTYGDRTESRWEDGRLVEHKHTPGRSHPELLVPYLRVKAGDRLWVRESYFQFGHWEPITGARTKGGRQKWGFVADRSEILFESPAQFRRGMHHADPATPAWHKRLGRFMPRAASRLTLTVTDVRVQRLQEISADDAGAEGVTTTEFWRPKDVEGKPFEDKWWDDLTFWQNYPQIAFRALWESINGAGSWDANPWVAAYTFTVERRNIDVLAKDAA